jgi:hypothetical protein
MRFDFMDIILLRSGHQHVSATRKAIFFFEQEYKYTWAVMQSV